MEFKTEHQMVESFIPMVDSNVWTVYPETGDFDLLLSRKIDGLQIGIEAKLHLNAKVISQAAKGLYHRRNNITPGPDCRAVLVPWSKRNDFETLLSLMHIVPLRIGGRSGHLHLSQSLPNRPSFDDLWPEHYPSKRLALPDYVPDVKAGVAGPTKLTDWKIKAIKLDVLLARRGYVVRADFKRLDLSPTIWTQSGWLANSEVRGRWIKSAIPSYPDFQNQHPVNYAQIAADFDRWNAFDLEGVI